MGRNRFKLPSRSNCINRPFLLLVISNFTYMDWYTDALPHPSAQALSNPEVVGILQKKLELCRKTLTDKEYKSLPSIRHLEATLKYALLSHRHLSHRSREVTAAKRRVLEETTLRLVDRNSSDETTSTRRLTSPEIAAMLNLEPSTISEISILFPWFAKCEPLDVESMLHRFITCDTAESE